MLLFGLNDFGDARGGFVQLGIGALHQVAHGKDHLEQERLFLSQQSAVTNAATKNLAQHVAAAFVRRQTPSLDEERGGAGVVGDDAQAGCIFVSGARLLL